MPDQRNDDARDEGGQARKDPGLGGGYEGAGPEYGRGYGRDFGGGGRNQGFDGSWGQGYDGSLAPADYRQNFGGQAYAGGMAADNYELSYEGRGNDFGPDDRSWIDRCADDECAGLRRHRGRGPKDWSRDDRRIYEEVCERLLHDRLIDARGMSVEVEDGVVTLSGQARAAADPRLAERLVRETPGVREVRLELVVAARPGPQPAEEPPSDDRVDKSSFTSPIIPGRAPPPDAAGAP